MRELLLFSHILFAMVWVGGIMFVGWGIFPASRKFSFADQRQLFLAVMKWAHPFFLVAGFFVIVTGVLLGTVFGPLASWEAIYHTPYGQKWLAALLVGVVTLFWGTFVGYFQMMKVFQTDFYWVDAEQGDPSFLYRQYFRLAVLESVEVFGFMVLLYIMVSF